MLFKMKQRRHSLASYMMAALLIVSNTVAAQAENEETKQWPDLPLLTIETIDHVEPTATVVTPPEGCLGTSIVSEHVPGRMVITLKGETLYDSGDYIKGESGMRMKIRGNSTGAHLPQHPYKLKLSKKADLLTPNGGKAKSKDWALLSVHTWNKAMKGEESNILTEMGNAVCSALGFSWVPRTQFVNLVLNGKYQGIYHLSETFERSDSRVNIGKKGLLIENDAYWWKPGEVYFKTNHQNEAMGYTFKYPDSDDVTEAELANITTYMNSVEEAIFSDNEADNYLDYTEFARWILAHDILGSNDAAGSNAYLYKNELSENEPNDDKLKMATLWDLDSSFLVDDNTWSNQHKMDVFYYPELFKKEGFVEKYKELYNEKKDGIYASVSDCLNKMKDNIGEAFEQSRAMHQEVFKGECVNTLSEQIDDVLTHLKTRLDALETMVPAMNVETGISNVQTPTTLWQRTDLFGRNYTHTNASTLPSQIYIEKMNDGTVRKVFKK